MSVRVVVVVVVVSAVVVVVEGAVGVRLFDVQ